MKTADLLVVLKVAELQSITAAANQLDMSSSAASVSLKRIEQTLGAELFVRSTRKLRLSPEGERYLPYCQQALDLLQQGQAVITEEQQVIGGEVRLAVSSEMGRNLMRELLNRILQQHPALQLRLHVSDSRTDFYRDGVDVALRAMTKEAVIDSNLYGFKICNIPHFICASPDYLKRNGTPISLEELTNHNALLYKLYDQLHDSWELIDDKGSHKVKMKSDRAVNDGDIVRRWCVDGVGVAKKSAIDVADDLLQGRLVRVMPNHSIPRTEMWLALPSRQLISPAVRVIRDELKQAIAEIRSSLLDKGILHESEWPLDD